MQEERDAFNKGMFGFFGAMGGCCALPFILLAAVILGFLLLGALGAIGRLLHL